MRRGGLDSGKRSLLRSRKIPVCVDRPSVSAVTVELSKETLDTMLGGLGRIRDQLSRVARSEGGLWAPTPYPLPPSTWRPHSAHRRGGGPAWERGWLQKAQQLGREEAAGLRVSPHSSSFSLSEAGGQKPVSPQGSWWGGTSGPLSGGEGRSVGWVSCLCLTEWAIQAQVVVLVLVSPCPVFTLLAELASALEHVQGSGRRCPQSCCSVGGARPTPQGRAPAVCPSP